MKKLLNIAIVFLILFMTLMPAHSAEANSQEISTLGDTPAAWPKVFTSYTHSDGTPVLDPAADVHPIDVDITSGVDKGYGYLPSMYVASDGTNLFVRLRLKGNPYDRKGGFLSSVWLVKLAVNGETKATIGLDGKSPHTDYVYVANANGTNAQPIYKTDGSGNTVSGTRIVEAENRQYFMDFQVPIKRITEIAPEITSSTPVQFFFGTSKAANLSVINKEWMDTESSNGKEVDFNGLSSWILNEQPLTVTIDGGSSQEYNSTTGFTLTGMTSLESGTASIAIDGTSYSVSVNNNQWSFTLPSTISGVNGTYTAIVSFTDSGETATAEQQVIIDTGSSGLITIDGGSQATTNSTNPTISGTAGGSNGSKVQLFVHNDADNTNQSDVEVDTNANNGTWSTSVALPNSVDGQVYTLVAKYTSSNGSTVFATTSQKLTYQSTATSASFPSVSIGTVTGDAVPTIQGSSSGADQIEVQVDGVTAGIVTPAGDGSWRLSLEKPYAQVSHEVKAIAKNRYGSAVAKTTYTIGTTSVSIDNGTSLVTIDKQPTIRGNTNASDGAKITVEIQNNQTGVIETYTVKASNGRWVLEYPLDKELSDDTYTVTVSVGSESATQTLTVDTSTFVIITKPGDGSSSSQTKPTLSGKSEKAATVELVLTDKESNIAFIKNVTAAQDPQDANKGDWSYTLVNSLPVGTYVLTATASDINGNEAVDTSTFSITLTTVSIAGVAPVTTTVANGTSEADAKAALGTTVKVTLENGTKVEVPITWSEDSTRSYDGNTAGDYEFTGTFGTLPEGIDNEGDVSAPTGTVTVKSASTESIKSVSDVTKSVANGTSEADAKAALGTAVEVTLENGTKTEVPITWSEDSSSGYDGNTTGDYEFTGTFGTLPEGIDNKGNVSAPTGTVTVKSASTESIKSVSDVTKSVANGTSKANAKAALGTTVEVTLESGTKIDVPITWSEDSSPSYDGNTAGGYEFTGTFGTLPDGIDNKGDVSAPTGTVTVEPALTESIKSVSDVTKSVANGTSKANAKAALGTTVEVTLENGTKMEVPITWSEDSSSGYDGNTAGDYEFTGIFGTLPEGIDNKGNVSPPTGTVTVEAPSTESIKSVSDVTKSVANGTSKADAKAALGTTVEVTLENGTKIEVPLTWSEDSSPSYDGNTAGDYEFTGTFGTLPKGIDNKSNISPPKGTITVLKALSNETQIISTNFGKIDGANHITGVPAGTKVSDFLAGLNASKNAKAEILDENGDVVANPAQTDVSGGMALRITAEDGGVSLYPISIVWPVELQLTSDPKSLVGDGESQATLKAVIKDLSGKPIPHVAVQFTAGIGTLSKTSVKTNDQGVAVVTLTSPRIEGTESITKYVTASVVDPVKGISEEGEISIHFQPPIIVGQVLDAAGQPIANATVWILVDGKKIMVITDSDGNYSITVPRGGNYMVHIKVSMLVDGQEVTSTYTQQAQVESTGLSEQYRPDRKVSGQLFVKTRNHKIKTTQEMFPDSVLSIHVLNDSNGQIRAKINQDGMYELTGFVPGKTYQVVFSVKKNGEQLAGKLSEITVGADGQIVVENELIDPFGIAADSVTGAPIPGVNMKIYWADTKLNREKGRIPNTLVKLPVLDNFPPNQNHNPQLTTGSVENSGGYGNYAWMLFANGDYYIVAEKDGYKAYDSRKDLKTNTQLGDSWIRDGIIHIGKTMMRYDISMDAITSKSTDPSGSSDPPAQTSKPKDPSPSKDTGTTHSQNGATMDHQIEPTDTGKTENNLLPVTATHTYDFIFAGLLMIGLGIFMMVLRGWKNWRGRKEQ